MSKEMNVSTWIEKYDDNAWVIKAVEVQCDAGWYDWFCNDEALPGKTARLGKKVKQIAESSKINKETMYVWFKNNCPMNGPLYDDFRFADMETGEVQYTITPRSGHSGEAEVWGRENRFDGALKTGTWSDIKEFFGV